MDLVSGSNCCAPRCVHVWLGQAGGRFAPRRDVVFHMPDLEPLADLLLRGTTRPHVLDWNGDGRAELVIGHVGRAKLYIVPDPLSGQERITAQPVALPVPENTHLYQLAFADWDGDGRRDVVAAGAHRKKYSDPFEHAVFWLRNTTSQREPAFALPQKLVAIDKPWEPDGIAVIDWDQDAQLDVLLSVDKDWKRDKARGWLNSSELRLYRRASASAPSP